MRIVTFTAIAALITPSPVANVAHGQGWIDGGTVIDSFSSFASNTAHGRGAVDGAGSSFVLLSYGSDIVHGRGAVDGAGSIGFASSQSADVYGRGIVDSAGSAAFASSQSADVYGRGQVDAAESATIIIATAYGADVYGRGQVDAAESAVATGLTFTYSSDGDTNDILNFVGKNYSSGGTWTNPHTAGRVTVSYSSSGGFGTALENLVDRANNAANFTDTISNSFFQIDFGGGKSVTPSTYSIQGTSQTGYYPRSWKLKGSNDGTNWTDLNTQTGNTSMNTPDAWVTCAVTGASNYRYLRVEQTGVNTNGDNYFVFGEFQVYGTFTF